MHAWGCLTLRFTVSMLQCKVIAPLRHWVWLGFALWSKLCICDTSSEIVPWRNSNACCASCTNVNFELLQLGVPIHCFSNNICAVKRSSWNWSLLISLKSGRFSGYVANGSVTIKRSRGTHFDENASFDVWERDTAIIETVSLSWDPFLDGHIRA